MSDRIEPGSLLGDEFEALHRAALAAYAAGDLQALMAGYAADAALIEPDKLPIRGRPAIEAALRQWFERFEFGEGRCTLWEGERVGERFAWDLSAFELDACRRRTGECFREQWKQLSLWQRGTDGRWRLRRLMFNSHRSG